MCRRSCEEKAVLVGVLDITGADLFGGDDEMGTIGADATADPDGPARPRKVNKAQDKDIVFLERGFFGHLDIGDAVGGVIVASGVDDFAKDLGFVFATAEEEAGGDLGLAGETSGVVVDSDDDLEESEDAEFGAVFGVEFGVESDLLFGV